MIRKCGIILQTLNIYGAVAIVSLGWALSCLLHFQCAAYLPLWFFAALFIYNLDRLRHEPADLINLPDRSRHSMGLRRISRTLAILSATTLMAIPVMQHDWLMSILTVTGAFICVNYSVPLLGFRFKDIPLLKTFFVPTLVTAAFLIPPLLQQPLRDDPLHHLFLSAWAWCVAFFNMILCDLRDIEGDSRTGIRTLPVTLGRRRTFQILLALLACSIALSIGVLFKSKPSTIVQWACIAAIMPIYLGCLLAAARKPRPESFYEWWVDGILFVPALVYLILR
ncbi:MAG: UbiA family prenyltransferase [Verrucomicrobiales bacterium]|jgi:4-hydroxybenzoate polyprenyltransferase|nr:UbiA family prenyltransferase [Verrucomicrobiales bacterium]